MSLRRVQAGFSLIELLVVVLIIGILSSIAIPSLLKNRQRTARSVSATQVRIAFEAARGYYAEHDSYDGMTAEHLKGEELGLFTYDCDPGPAGVQPCEPGDPGGPGAQPGPNAAPSSIWIGDGDTDANPTGPTSRIVLCSVSRGDSILCIYDHLQDGVTRYETFDADRASLTDVNGTGAGTATPGESNILNADRF